MEDNVRKGKWKELRRHGLITRHFPLDFHSDCRKGRGGGGGKGKLNVNHPILPPLKVFHNVDLVVAL